MAYEALGRAIEAFAIIFVIAVPLGVWKLVDIVIWLITHIVWN